MYSRQREDCIEGAKRTSDLSRVYDFGVLDYDFGMLSASDYCFGEGTVRYAMVRLLLLPVLSFLQVCDLPIPSLAIDESYPIVYTPGRQNTMPDEYKDAVPWFNPAHFHRKRVLDVC